MNLFQKVKQSKLVTSVSKWTSGVKVPGGYGLNLKQATYYFGRQLKGVRLNERSAAVTYTFLLAIPPLLLFFCSLIPYLPLHNVTPSVLSIIKIITPNERSFKGASEVVLNFINQEQRGILSFGVLLTLFFSTNGMNGLLLSFDRDNGIYVKRKGLPRRWMAIKLTFMLLLVIIISIATLILQSAYINEYLREIFGEIGMVKSLSVVLMISLIFLAICTVYRFGPSLVEKIRFFSVGAVIATLLCLSVSAGFFFAINNFLQYNKLYGSIGTLIAFMVWVWLNVLVILIGYELNVSLLRGKLELEDEKKQTKA